MYFKNLLAFNFLIKSFSKSLLLRKNIKLQKTRSYFMCHLSRSWYVKKAKTDRDLSAKHEGQ